MKEQEVDACLALFTENRQEITYFLESVKTWMASCETRHKTNLLDVYAVKGRLKDIDHLKDKLQRKQDITPENFFDRVTDLAGVRVLHLFPSQFGAIHSHIKKRLGNDWILHEPPKAYTWDPETSKFFSELDIEVAHKESYYTSVHYVVKPNNPQSFARCEIQVRTLLEEVWGEIDHGINYPKPTEIHACRDQLLVLAKLIGAGSRLISSIESADAR
jgi:ppGpp synthetase/RelA/SpoT-type nucleotidyltranferase